jgi:hypothetical protein
VLLATAAAARYRQDQVNAQARWTAPDGTGRTGTVLAPPETRADRVVMVWVDMTGRPAGDRPLQLSQARDEAELAAVLTPLALGPILLGAAFSVHVMLGRRRLAAWDADWQSPNRTGPKAVRGHLFKGASRWTPSHPALNGTRQTAGTGA